MKKRVIALLLCLVLTVSCLAGCGGDNSEGGTPTNNSSTQSTPAGNSGGENETPDSSSDPPAVDTSEPITVSIFQQADDVTMDEVENNPVTLYWEKMFNIDIQWQFPPQGSEQEQLTMMLGTGDYTEVMNLSFSQENLTSLYQDGVIWDLSPYLEQYAPNYYAYLNDPANADVRSILYDEDGHIYNMATVPPCSGRTPASPFTTTSWRKSWILPRNFSPSRTTRTATSPPTWPSPPRAIWARSSKTPQASP